MDDVVKRGLAGVIAFPAAGCGAAPGAAPPAKPPPAPARRAVHHAGMPTIAAQRAQLARSRGLGRPVYGAAGRQRLVALPFDDGPGPYTRLALKELDAAHVHATFFVVAKSIVGFS